MAGFVLLVDDQGRVESSLAKVLAGTSLTIESFTDPNLAKRRLIEAAPRLIVSLTTFQNLVDGGFRLAQEISAHAQLSHIPVVLVADQLTEDVIANASRSGATSLVPWPVTIESFRNRLKPFLEAELTPKEEKPSVSAAVSTPAVAEPFDIPKPIEKIQLAQQLLAKVLHNLKTSALLEVVDKEDVPRVVLEITRAVCGVGVSEQKQVEPTLPSKQPEVAPAPQQPASPPKVATPPAPSASKSEISIDLDAAFGRKNK